MKNKCKCGYCDHWLSSDVVKSSKDEVLRKCQIQKKRVSYDSIKKKCEYFKPQNNFFCDNYSHWIGFIVCLHRRANQSKLENYKLCDDCRQFDREVKDVIEEYFIEKKPVKDPPEKKEKSRKKLKRRPKKKGSRKLKRRKKKRVLKRR